MRIRTIKPDFFIDEDVARLSPLARLLFQALWTQADRLGRLEDRPIRIKTLALPYDNCNVEELLTELADFQFIIRYRVEGRSYIQVRSFEKHQRPNVKESESILPAPQANGTKRNALGTKKKVPSIVSHVGKGREGKGSDEGKEIQRPAAAWSKEACQDWIDRFQGTAPGGRIGKALKPLVEKHGWESVQTAWQNYLARSEAAFASAERFAATFASWAPTSRAPSEADRLGAEIHDWINSRGGRDAVAAAIVSSGLSIETWLEKECGPVGAGPLLSQPVYHAKKAVPL